MTCRKCKRETPSDALYCPYCGVSLNPTKFPHKTRTRPNGAGTAYRRGKSWYAQVTVGWKQAKDGHSIQLYRTKGGFSTKRDALAYCQQLQSAPVEKPKQTLQQLYDAWLPAHEARVSKSTMDCYRAAYKYFDDLKYRLLCDIDVDDLQECLDACPRARRTRENMKAVIGLIYKYAIPRHQATMNLAEYLHTGDNDKSTRPPFTPEQVELIRRQINITPYADVIYTLIYTGFRPAELFALTKSDYRDGILYGGIKTEAGKNRAVPVSPKVMPIIESRAAATGGYLFPRADGSQMSVSYFRDNCFYPVLAAAGIQPLPTPDHPAYYTPYSCRHTFANLLKSASGSDVDKARLIGHADYTTTKKLYQSAELDAMRKIISEL